MNLQGLSRFNDTTYRYFDNTLDRILTIPPNQKKNRIGSERAWWVSSWDVKNHIRYENNPWKGWRAMAGNGQLGGWPVDDLNHM